jgi:ABC-type uncharacterized transport system permease subunit
MEPIAFITNFVSTVLRMSTPIILGAVGATFCERSGVINIGIEGMMITGAFAAAAAAFFTGSPWLGMLAGLLAGMLMGSFLGLLAVYLGGDQIVIGIGINILGLGGTTLGVVMIWGNRGTSGWLQGLPEINMPLISKIPVIGAMISGADPTVYLSWLAVVIIYLVLYHTPLGQRIRAAGEHPRMVETVGVDIFRLRFLGTLVSGALAGLAGVSLSLGTMNVFSHGMTSGRGFLAFAANMFGQWHPFGAFAASLLFGVMDALRMNLQGLGIPSQFLQMFPYLATLIVITLAGKKARAPAALGALFPYSLKKHGHRNQHNAANDSPPGHKTSLPPKRV